MKIAVRRTPSTSQKSSAEPSWSLIRLVSPTGMTKKRPTASSSEKAIVSPQTQPPISSALAVLVLLELGVGRDRQRLEADLQRLAEGDDAAQDRHPPEAVTLRPGLDRLGADLDLAVGTAHGDGPDRDAAHHHALQHRLAADRRVALGDQGAVGHAQRIRPVAGRSRRRDCGEPTSGLTDYLPALACLAARRWKRSTRPPVSTSFCLPV